MPSRPATRVITILDESTSEARKNRRREHSSCKTTDVRITKDSSRRLKACWRGNSEREESRRFLCLAMLTRGLRGLQPAARSEQGKRSMAGA